MINEIDENTVQDDTAEFPAPLSCTETIKDSESWLSMAIALGFDTEAD